ncbi:MAG: hypothetical protein ACK4UO_02195 [Pseudolabrys sp.]
MPPADAPDEALSRRHDDVKKFMAAIAVVLRETVTAFEDTVARVTEMTVMKRPDQADRELVVALQNFDRLQQEFHSLSEVLVRLSALPGEHALLGEAGPREPGYDVLATVAVADLKQRLSRHLRTLLVDLPAGDASDEAVF